MNDDEDLSGGTRIVIAALVAALVYGLFILLPRALTELAERDEREAAAARREAQEQDVIDSMIRHARERELRPDKPSSQH